MKTRPPSRRLYNEGEGRQSQGPDRREGDLGRLGASVRAASAGASMREDGGEPSENAVPNSGQLLASTDLDSLAAALAPRLATLLRAALGAQGAAGPQRYVDAATVAALFGVERSWVYAHKDELGVLRVGSGRRARLRFDVSRVAAALERRELDAVMPGRGGRSGPRPRRRRATSGDGAVKLIPYDA